MEYQHRVAAWVAVRILAEHSASAPWDLPANTTLEALQCEPNLADDDVRVSASGGEKVYIQAKRTLSLSARPASEFAKVADQFVRLIHSIRERTSCINATGPAQGQHCLVLVTTSQSPATVRVSLKNVLERARRLLPGQALSDAATNRPEEMALQIARGHISRSWLECVGRNPSESELREILSHVRVQSLDVGAGDHDEDQAKQLLRTAVLFNPNQADIVWSSLISTCQQMAAQRTGADRAGLQRDLRSLGAPLQTVRSALDDVRQLRAYTEATSALLRHLSELNVDNSKIKLERQGQRA